MVWALNGVEKGMTEVHQPSARRVLLVNQDPVVPLWLRETAERAGWAIEHFHRGQEALEACARALPRLAILADPLGDMATADFLEQARRLPQGIPPFIVWTQANDARSAVEWMRRGAWDCWIDDGRAPETLPQDLARVLTDLAAEDERAVERATLQEHSEADRRRRETRQHHTQRLESLGVLAGGIAHDFNNLLAAILGNAELAQLELPADSPVRENLENVVESAQRASQLVGQMLVYSGRGRYSIQMLDLNQIVRDLERGLPSPLPSRIALRIELGPTVPHVQGDAGQIRAMLLHLVTNAVEAMGDREGTVRIATGMRDCDRAFLQSTLLDDDLAEGNYAFIEVADTGCGIALEAQHKIFDPFFSTKFAGRGLGLPAVLGVIRAHAGAIRFTSALGEGSTFQLLLPAAVGAVPEQAPAPACHPEWRGSGTILVVDDEESMRRVARKYLARLGFLVTVAVDGSHALDLFRKAPRQFAGVLLDFAMPHMDGEATFRELRAIRPDIKVVLASGYTEPEATARFSGRELAGFIQKPYTLDALREVLRKALSAPVQKPVAPPPPGWQAPPS